MYAELSEWNSEADCEVQLSYFIYMRFSPQIKSNFPPLASCYTVVTNFISSGIKFCSCLDLTL